MTADTSIATRCLCWVEGLTPGVEWDCMNEAGEDGLCDDCRRGECAPSRGGHYLAVGR